MLADDKTRAAHFLSAEKKNDDGEKKSDDGAGARAHAVFLGLLAVPRLVHAREGGVLPDAAHRPKAGEG
jgi:hypothetical protein